MLHLQTACQDCKLFAKLYMKARSQDCRFQSESLSSHRAFGTWQVPQELLGSDASYKKLCLLAAIVKCM